MGGEEGPWSAAHVEGGPAMSRAGGICGHSATGNRQLAGACSTLGREAPRLAGVSRAPGVGSGQAPVPMEGGAPRDRLSSCVRPHPPWSGTRPAQQALRPGPGLSGPLQGRMLPPVRFPVSHPGTWRVSWGARTGCAGSRCRSRVPGAGVGVGVVAAPPKPVSPGGARVPLRLGGDRPASQPPWGRGCRSLPSGVQPRLSVRLLG